MDYALRTGDTSCNTTIANTFEKNRGSGFLNQFYDDEGWWALAWIRAYDLIHDGRYLDAAGKLFGDMQRGWDGVCSGGLWWNKERRYKNAITNELFLKVGAELHRRGYDGLGWARRTWAWFAGSGLINERHLVNDGLTSDCRNNGGTTWSYNQGVILGGLVALAEIDGDSSLLATARQIADAAIAALSNDAGILLEPGEPNLGNDGPQFKGIFARYLRELYDATGEPRYREFLVANAESLWARSRDSSGFLGVRWTGPFDRADAARQSSGIDLFNATLSFGK